MVMGPALSGNGGWRGVGSFDKPVKADKKAKVNFKPKTPIISYTPPAPTYRAPAPVYTPPPAPAYSPPSYTQAPVYSTPIQQNYNPPAPPSPPPPPRIKSKSDWLAGDTTFNSQKKDYNQELQKFLDRLTKKRSDFDEDYELAVEGLNRNKESGLEALGQDFSNRGLGYSGMFLNANDEAVAGYERQESSLEKSSDRQDAEFDSQEDDAKREKKQKIANSRAESLDRRAMKAMAMGASF